MTGTCFSLEVRPRIPPRLARLEELANDLYYSWSSYTRRLFVYLDAELWESCSHNPKLFLRRVSQQRLERAEQDRTFLEAYHQALSEYDTYMEEAPLCEAAECLSREHDVVAYFCLEFGFHESIPVYSGGLGILAGDLCKAASDLAVPLVAVGLLYRQGYFTQEIDRHGTQVALFRPTDFSEIPIFPVLDQDGSELRVPLEIAGQELRLRVWMARAGRVALYLLDCDLPENSEADRAITYQLYGGDTQVRIRQEIVLGVGGVKALRAMGYWPTAWHINEGHAAFSIIERCRERVVDGMDFDTAMELIASGTVFTTHTPVPAGHDVFDRALVGETLGRLVQDMGIPLEQFLGLGASPTDPNAFNMTALALRGSRFCNGVSQIHSRVASEMEGYIWPEIPPDENPIGHVTNGVHLSTFLSTQWRTLFDTHLGGEWRNEILNPYYWAHIDHLPDYAHWGTRQSLKSDMLKYVRTQAMRQYERNGNNPVEIKHLTQHLNPERTDILILGFARRFATYKRATLLFRDPDRLGRLLGDPQRPVLILFAGKAHPDDIPGQQLIRAVYEMSMRPEFQGKIVLLENYDLALARWLVSGVDVWLNTPEYPLEASGTSGQKAGINGVLNLSVLDGWWGEAYDGTNGWAITPDVQSQDREERERIESQALLDILEEHVIPLYYRRDEHGYSEGWVRMSKASMKTIIPRFNSARMVRDYVQEYYLPASRQRAVLAENGARGARELAVWKHKIRDRWDGVRLWREDDPEEAIHAEETLRVRVGVDLAGLSPVDVVVECLVGRRDERTDELIPVQTHRLMPEETTAQGRAIFALDLRPSLPGLQHYKLRIFPFHPLLSHPHEMGFMRWI